MRRLSLAFGPRARVLSVVVLAGCLAGWQLKLNPQDLIPSAASWNKTLEFFSAAFSPAIRYETTPPTGTEPLLKKTANAVALTVAFAVAAVGLALLIGLPLGFLASSAWWEDDPVGGQDRSSRFFRRLIVPTIVWSTRLAIVITRSIHELMWAVLFLCAMGLNTLTAILAITIPFSGVFAKVFSEMIDETPRDAAYAIRGLGASPFRVFLFGLLPRAIPDMLSYACYRLECGMRSSAVLGFFGIPTLGYYLKPSFDESHYREVWTYLYALIALIVFVDWWCGVMRARLVR